MPSCIAYSHARQNDATLLKGSIRFGKLVVSGCILSSNAVIIFYIFCAVFRKIWANGSLELHDDLCWGPMRSMKVIT